MIILLVIAVWVANIATFVASWAGLSYLIGPLPAVIFIAIVFFLLRWSWWLAPTAFVGAYFVWEWPWYGALAIAMPGVLLMLPAMTAAGIADWRERRRIERLRGDRR